MIRTIVTAMFVLCLVSCITAPTPNPIFVDKIDTQFNAAKSQNFRAAGKFKRPIPYEVGQYVIAGMTSPTERSIMKMAIVGKEQNGWIIETHSLTQSAESITQMLVVGMETVNKTGKLDDLDIIWVKVKPDGQNVQTIEGPMLSMTKGLYKKALSGLECQNQEAIDGGTVKVPAGTFAGTSKMHSEVSFMGNTYLSDSWLHPSVPINAMVKSVSNEGETVIELLDFGLTGAKRSF
ncbi:hypothetical protein DSCW_54660 [Desulfosarcina widdelii]|uniref:Lipoprotein n=2 Tax=Desulfosarcina widdelii TaxID=947919 RepID=A0A5K7ZCZ0_9BACT|nr:hypothetical protein DSCW_54660 [Desulfosarcina widdelii]